MEPVGPWFSASYNRLTNPQHAHSSAPEHGGAQVQAQVAPTSQLFLGSHHSMSGPTASPFPTGSGFLSPQQVTYDPVFNPLFHQKSHYRPFKQPSEVESYNYISSSGGNYFEQTGSSTLWSQNAHSSFGVLPHEAVIPSQVVSHFTPQINHYAQSEYKNLDYDNRKFSTFCQPVNEYPKFQQSFAPVQEGLRFPQPSYRGNQFFPRADCECPPRCVRPLFHTDAKPGEQSQQSSPISYAMFDSHRNYATNKTDAQPFQLNNINYNRFSAPEDCVQRSRAVKGLVESYNGRYLDQSPNYALYYHNSPVTASSSSTPSPVQEPPETDLFQHVRSDPPLDVSLPRPTPYAATKPVPDKTSLSCRVADETWDRERRIPEPKSCIVESQAPFQTLKSCRGDPMSLVKTLQQQTVVTRRNFEPDKKLGADFLNRVPPPAHHNTFNQPVQNGYFDFDRWNTAKIFSSSATLASQNEHCKFSFHPSTPHFNQNVLTPLPTLPLPSPVPGITIEEPIEVHKESIEPMRSPYNHTPIAKRTKDERILTIEEELEVADVDISPCKPMYRPKPHVGFVDEFVKFVQKTESKSSRRGPNQPKSDRSEGGATVRDHSKLSSEIGTSSGSCARDQLEVPSEEDKSKRFKGAIPESENVPNQQLALGETNKRKPIEKFPFKVGEFVVVKGDLFLLHPPVWRVKKNNLLQKFTHFVTRGVVFYSNAPVFSGWSPETKKVYEKVEFRIVKQWKEDYIIRIIPTNMLVMPYKKNDDSRVEEFKKYRETFEVYVQTLFSQALDSKFLNEIRIEKDEYFLDYVRNMETFWSDLIAGLVEALPWEKTFVEVLSQSPNYRYVQASQESCVCSKKSAVNWVSLGGLTYSSKTLELSKTPFPQKVLGLCEPCKQYFELLHKLSHQKYMLFSVCDNVVSSKKAECLNLDASTILNDLLKDDDWFEKLFNECVNLWMYAEKVTQDALREKMYGEECPSSDHSA